jgi:hypothetical protein
MSYSSQEFGKGTTINLYTKEGDPVRAIAVPGEGLILKLAYNGKQIVVSKGSGLLVFTAGGKPVGKFNPAVDGTKKEQEYWQPFFAPDGKALLLFRHGTHDVYRYKWE